jgi:glyoxylase-like metal-dependent hydrolase (beta-lactamase superfamily II)
MIKIKQFVVNPLRESSYLLSDSTSEAVIVDPGMRSEEEFEVLSKYINENSLKLKMVLLTHGHFDHSFGVDRICREYNIPYYMHPADVAQFERAIDWCPMMGFTFDIPQATHINLYGGEQIKFGESVINVYSTPGHSEGSVSFYLEECNTLISGDTLFCESVGRTDLPGGNSVTLSATLNNLFDTFSKETKVLPGHGPSTTFEHELSYNPFL